MTPFKPFSLNLKGNLLEVNKPLVMGIVNVTPDSFYSASRCSTLQELRKKIEEMILHGVDIIDVGGYSSRPGADDVDTKNEIQRITSALETIRSISAELPISIDTFRAEVARIAVEHYSADIINDISGGQLDNKMFETVAELRVPYILMHMRGTPATMQSHCEYANGVTAEVIKELSGKIHNLERIGVSDIIIDPGFGFSKTLQQNYALLSSLPEFIRILNKPLLVGISRKSMITKPLEISSDEALPATSALHLFALEHGASILRVHDVENAKQIVKLYHQLNQCYHSL